LKINDDLLGYCITMYYLYYMTNELNQNNNDTMETLEIIKEISEKYKRGIKVDGRFLTLQDNTFEIKDQLKADGFKFDPKGKEWYLELPEKVNFDSSEIRYYKGQVEELGYNDSFDLLFDEKPGLYLGKIDDGYITIEL